MSETVQTEAKAETQTEMLTPKEYEEKLYFEWLEKERKDAQEKVQRCREAELVVRQYYEKNPGHEKVDPQPWEVDGLTEPQRQQERTRVALEKFYADGNVFSPAAHLLVTSHDAARFFDDGKCGFLGDSDHLGWFREISPSHNDTGFTIDHNYSEGRLNAWTESGIIVHTRETLDPRATTREQKMFIVVMNLMTRQVTRLYADDIENIDRSEYADVVSLLPAIESHLLTDDDTVSAGEEAALATVTQLKPITAEISEEAGDEEPQIILPTPNLTPVALPKLSVSGVDEVISLKPHKFTSYNGQPDVDDTKPFAGLSQKLADDNAKALLPKLKKAAQGHWAYKDDGRTEYETLHSIKELDMQRRLLGQIAIAEGLTLDDRGVIIRQTSAASWTA